ncbi:MAG: hypothetical protein K5780_04765 [Alphaproteobacteria bacterium]|nr:hypothetical protein [Alphaproteobacteria bacterium]
MNIDRVALACGVRSLFVLMLIMGSGGIVSVEGQEVREVEKSVEIKAHIPAYLDIEILQGEEGIKLLNENGDTQPDENKRTVKFKVTGTFTNAKLSFAGSGGLDYNRDNAGVWQLSHANREIQDKFETDISLTGVGNRQSIKNDPVDIDSSHKGAELSLIITPRKDRNSNPNMIMGDYAGKLTIKVEIPD